MQHHTLCSHTYRYAYATAAGAHGCGAAAAAAAGTAASAVTTTSAAAAAGAARRAPCSADAAYNSEPPMSAMTAASCHSSELRVCHHCASVAARRASAALDARARSRLNCTLPPSSTRARVSQRDAEHAHTRSCARTSFAQRPPSPLPTMPSLQHSLAAAPPRAARAAPPSPPGSCGGRHKETGKR
jgi:hypothetical protein